MTNTLRLLILLALALSGMDLAAGVASPPAPSFFARRDYPIYTNFMQVADTNGDGIPDLITTQPDYIEVQLGNGDGTFSTGPASQVAATATVSFVAVDLNGDGKIDLALADAGIYICTGNGNGTFSSGVFYPISDTGVGYLVVGDFNGDGILDIAATGQTGVWLLTGKGGGVFNSAVLAASLSGASTIAAADFNQDGKLDLAITRFTSGLGNGFAVLLGKGNGTFQTPQTFSTPTTPRTIAVGSLTKGGPPGIAVDQAATTQVYLYPGNGAGGFSAPQTVTLPNGENTSALVIGDVNGDGIPDLVSNTGSIAFGQAGGAYAKPVSYPINLSGASSSVALADLRNNGLTDIVTSSTYAISVLLNTGTGLFKDGVWTNVTGGASCGVKNDFNHDGKPDLAVNTPSGISILLGTGNYFIPFSAGTNIALPGAGCLAEGDLNGDGIGDLLVPVNGTVVAYLGNGKGGFTLKSTTPTPSGGYLAVGDFNHDGKLDFATSGNLIALGNGDGTFRNPTDIVSSPPAAGFSGIAAGDINKDGWTDLVLTNSEFFQANLTVLLNNEMGGFTQVAANFGSVTTQPILTDLNQDGYLDLVLRPNSSGAEIYLGNGTGTFTSQTVLSGPGGAAGFNYVADVNGDGIPDLLVLGYETVDVYLGEGSATYAPAFGLGVGPSPASVLVENLHGQSATAGLPDIVVPDTSRGVMELPNVTLPALKVEEQDQ